MASEVAQSRRKEGTVNFRVAGLLQDDTVPDRAGIREFPRILPEGYQLSSALGATSL
jgi:hypothetical protein